MHKGFRVVTVCPVECGECIDVLAAYLAANRHIIDTCEFWINTDAPATVNKVHELERVLPGFIRCIDHNAIASGPTKRASYYRRTCDTDTIYIRIEEDVVYFSPGAIEGLLDFRIDHPDYFIVSPATINNVLQTHLLQRRAVLTTEYGKVPFDSSSSLGRTSGWFAEVVHRRFLEDVCRRDVNPYRSSESFVLFDFEHTSLECACYFGRDFRDFAGAVSDNEERWLSTVKPLSLNRPNCLFFGSVAAHYSYDEQRGYLATTDILAQYRRLSESLLPAQRDYSDLFGWMDFEDVYQAALDEFPDGSHLVEVGSLLGQSIVYLAQEAARRGKRNLRIDAVDIWEGDLLPRLQANLVACGVANAITIRHQHSVLAARATPDESIHFLMIDACHDYESVRDDIHAWWPKIRRGGWLVCHDYANLDGVHRAFVEAFGEGHGASVCAAVVRKTGPDLAQHETIDLPFLPSRPYAARGRWHQTDVNLSADAAKAMELVAFHATSDGIRGLAKLITLSAHPSRGVSGIAAGSLRAMLDLQRMLIEPEAAAALLLSRTAAKYPLAERLSALQQVKRIPREAVMSADEPTRAGSVREDRVVDGLRRMEIQVPQKLRCDRCIASVISPGYENSLDLMLETLRAHGQVEEATLVVFLVDANDHCRQIAKKHGAHIFEANSITQRSPAVKGALYTLADYVDAQSYLLLEADLAILDSMRPVFEYVEAHTEPVLAGVAAMGNTEAEKRRVVSRDFDLFYDIILACTPDDWQWLTGGARSERPAGFCYLNGGLLALNQAGMLALTTGCRALQPFFPAWMDCAPPHIYFREEFCFNLVGYLDGMLHQLPERFNVQLQSPIVTPEIRKGRAYYEGEKVAVLHFASQRGKALLPQLVQELGLSYESPHS